MRPLPFLLLSFLLSPLAAGGATLKVGVIEIQRVVAQSAAGKQAREKFQAQVKQTEAVMLKEKQTLERMKRDLDKQGLLLQEEERSRIEREFQTRTREYMRAMRDHQEDLKQRETEITARILGEVRGIIKSLGETEGFTLIMERSQMLYGGEALDVTDKVIELYDREFRSKAKPKAK